MTVASTTIWWHPTGPKVSYEDGCVLVIEDLNPQSYKSWRMSRLELLKLGWNMMVTAITA